MELLIGIFIFVCVLAMFAGEVFLISALLKKIGNLNVLLKPIIAVAAFFVLNAPYIYVIDVRPELPNPIYLSGMIEACILSFIGFYCFFKDYYSAFKKGRAEKA